MHALVPSQSLFGDTCKAGSAGNPGSVSQDVLSSGGFARDCDPRRSLSSITQASSPFHLLYHGRAPQWPHITLFLLVEEQSGACRPASCCVCPDALAWAPQTMAESTRRELGSRAWRMLASHGCLSADPGGYVTVGSLIRCPGPSLLLVSQQSRGPTDYVRGSSTRRYICYDIAPETGRCSSTLART